MKSYGWIFLVTASLVGCGGSGQSFGADGGTKDSGGSPGDSAASDTSTGPTDSGAGMDSAASKDSMVPPPKDSGSGAMYSNMITITVEPSDDGSALYNSVSAATKSIHMTMYLFTSTSFQDLLISKYKAGLDVKVVLNQSYPTGGNENQSAYDKLQAAGVPVVWAPPAFSAPNGFTHEKCFILDGTSAWIMTMNVDESSAKDNREFLALDTDPSDVAEAETIFEGDFTNTASSSTGKLVVAPSNARPDLVALIGSAAHTVDVEDEEFSDYMIANALAAAAKKGIATRLVLSDDTPSSSQTMAVSQVKAAGTKVVVTHSPYIHAKTIVVDGFAAYVGSENLTTGSLEYNRELGLITSLASEVAKVESAFNTDFSAGTPQ